MGMLNGVVFAVIYCLVATCVSVSGRPATFLEDFKVTWSENHIRQLEGGRAIQLVLDQNSGSHFFNILHHHD